MKYTLFALSLSAASAFADVVTDWNTVALNAIRADNTSPPAASRNLAILHVAIYDAVNGIRITHEPYFVTATGPATASLEAAAAAAAHRVLISLYPSGQGGIETQYQNVIERLPASSQTAQGIEWGEFVASSILQSRSNDGSANTITYMGGTQPGQCAQQFPSVVSSVQPSCRSGAPFARLRSWPEHNSDRRLPRCLSARNTPPM